nr:DUF6682 family protein [Brucella anthropi]
MVKANEIMRKALTLLVDPEAVRWPYPELADWINSAIAAILIAKPSASTETRIVNLVAGTRQKLPDDGDTSPFMFMGARRNINADGTPGKVITSVSLNQMDMADPDWHSARRKRAVVQHFLFDEHVPEEYYVYPYNDGTGRIEAVFAIMPPKIEATGEPDDIDSYDQDVGLPEPYSEPIIDYVCYRAQSKDSTGGDAGRAVAHYQAFAQAIGIKSQIEASSSPNARRPA